MCSLEYKNQQLKNANSEQGTEIEKLKTNFGESEAALASLTNERDELKAANEQGAVSFKALQSKLETLQSASAGDQEAFTELSEKLSTKEADLLAKEQLLGKLQSELDSAKNDIENLNGSIAKKSTENAELVARVTAAESGFTEINGVLTTTNNQVKVQKFDFFQLKISIFF